ncbi:MAG TPA: hypothetical protein VIK84_07540 [Haloplasmataceae bacterium]
MSNRLAVENAIETHKVRIKTFEEYYKLKKEMELRKVFPTKKVKKLILY